MLTKIKITFSLVGKEVGGRKEGSR